MSHPADDAKAPKQARTGDLVLSTEIRLFDEGLVQAFAMQNDRKDSKDDKDGKDGKGERAGIASNNPPRGPASAVPALPADAELTRLVVQACEGHVGEALDALHTLAALSVGHAKQVCDKFISLGRLMEVATLARANGLTSLPALKLLINLAILNPPKSADPVYAALDHELGLSDLVGKALGGGEAAPFALRLLTILATQHTSARRDLHTTLSLKQALPILVAKALTDEKDVSTHLDLLARLIRLDPSERVCGQRVVNHLIGEATLNALIDKAWSGGTVGDRALALLSQLALFTLQHNATQLVQVLAALTLGRGIENLVEKLASGGYAKIFATHLLARLANGGEERIARIHAALTASGKLATIAAQACAQGLGASESQVLLTRLSASDLERAEQIFGALAARDDFSALIPDRHSSSVLGQNSLCLLGALAHDHPVRTPQIHALLAARDGLATVVTHACAVSPLAPNALALLRALARNHPDRAAEVHAAVARQNGLPAITDHIPRGGLPARNALFLLDTLARDHPQRTREISRSVSIDGRAALYLLAQGQSPVAACAAGLWHNINTIPHGLPGLVSAELEDVSEADEEVDEEADEEVAQGTDGEEVEEIEAAVEEPASGAPAAAKDESIPPPRQ